MIAVAAPFKDRWIAQLQQGGVVVWASAVSYATQAEALAAARRRLRDWPVEDRP